MANNNVILTYDISRSGVSDTVNAYVKGKMIEKGYADRFTNDEGKVVNFPNTTLLKSGINCSTAINDLRACLDEFNKKNSTTHSAERIFALPFNGIYAAIFGEPHKSGSLAPKL